MRHRISRQACFAVVAVGVFLSSAALPSVVAGQPVPVSAANHRGRGHSDDARLRGKIIKLPVTIPRADGSGALYPFGHGLSYGG